MVGHRNWIPFSSDRAGSIEKAKCTILGKNYAISCDTSLLFIYFFLCVTRRGEECLTGVSYNLKRQLIL